jgi:hypothetical protein
MQPKSLLITHCSSIAYGEKVGTTLILKNSRREGQPLSRRRINMNLDVLDGEMGKPAGVKVDTAGRCHWMW